MYNYTSYIQDIVKTLKNAKFLLWEGQKEAHLNLMEGSCKRAGGKAASPYKALHLISLHPLKSQTNLSHRVPFLALLTVYYDFTGTSISS